MSLAWEQVQAPGLIRSLVSSPPLELLDRGPHANRGLGTGESGAEIAHRKLSALLPEVSGGHRGASGSDCFLYFPWSDCSYAHSSISQIFTEHLL